MCAYVCVSVYASCVGWVGGGVHVLCMCMSRNDVCVCAVHVHCVYSYKVVIILDHTCRNVNVGKSIKKLWQCRFDHHN